MLATERLTPSRETWLAPEQPGESPLRLRYEGRAIALKFSCLAPQEVGEIVGTPTGFKSFVFDP